MSDIAMMDGGFGERDALWELLVAALTLCRQTRETVVADHVLDAIRALHGDDSDGEGGRVGFE